VTAAPSLTLNLLRGFDLQAGGEAIGLPLASQRLLAFLALKNTPLQRLYVAGALWMDSNEPRSYANLRGSLWRLRQTGHELVRATPQHLALAPTVEVDVHRLVHVARRALEPLVAEEEHVDHELDGELLPDWYDDWVESEREHVRQLRLHALEAVAERFLGAGRYGQAVDAGLAAIRTEPLRESAHRVLIRVYLAEGNPAEAVRCFTRYRARLAGELGLEPSEQMRALVVNLLR
jgi:DNA-binding SARP family transcriptional activator